MNHYENGRQKAENELAPKLARLGNSLAKPMTRSQIRKMLIDGRAELTFGDLNTVRAGGTIELYMTASKQRKWIQVEDG